MNRNDRSWSRRDVDEPDDAFVSHQNKRKEKARVAARARRSQEASIIMEMANELYITQEKMRRIDKATIVKLSIDYIKAFEILCRFDYRGGTIRQEQRHHAHKENNCTQPPQYSAPKLSTASIFAPKTLDNMNSHFLMIEKESNGPAFVLKPDVEILDEDDLTHLAPQAGDVSISLEVDPIENIVLDDTTKHLLTANGLNQFGKITSTDDTASIKPTAALIL